jgi:glycogen debranching enzyme
MKHQGMAWPWLLGPFVLAHLRVYGDAGRAVSFLQPMATQLFEYGVGTIGELFEGETSFAPRGNVADARSVAEVLRAWCACHEAGLGAARAAANA